MEVYFDNSATTRPFDEAINAAVETMKINYGNPSSLHRLGMDAEKIIKDAREVVSKKLKVSKEELYFTSGGTESNNIAIIGACNAMRNKGVIITSKIEHKSVLECFSYLENNGFTVKYLDVDKNGIVNLDMLNECMNENVSLVSIMHVNNETGAIQPIEKISKIIKDANQKTLFHVDDVQGFCKVGFNSKVADLISVSAHKVNGIKGCGALYCSKSVRLKPMIFGGGQENSIRSGTENVPAIAAFGTAVKMYNSTQNGEIKQYISDYVINNIDGCKINSTLAGTPYILNFSILGFKSETLLHLLEQQGIYVSSGSACSSNRPQLSHVLTAMGLERSVIESSIRLSFGNANSMEQAEYFCEKLKNAVEINKSVRRKYK